MALGRLVSVRDASIYLRGSWYSAACQPSTAVVQPEIASVNRVPVASSDLVSVGYDTTTGTLEIEFRNGAVYEYLRVPGCVHAGLMSAASHGRFFNQQIRNGGYLCTKIR